MSTSQILEAIKITSNITTDIFNIIVAIISGALLIIVSVLIIKRLFRKQIIFEVTGVPKEVTPQGYTENIIAERLLDSALKILEETRQRLESQTTLQIRLNYLSIVSNGSTPDIKVPRSGLSIKTIVRYIRYELGIASTYIYGEVVKTKKGFKLVLRKENNKRDPSIECEVEESIETLLKPEQGGAILLAIDFPIAAATYHYENFHENKSRKTPANNKITYEKFTNDLRSCEKYIESQPDKALICYLKGLAHYDHKEYKDAINQITDAINQFTSTKIDQNCVLDYTQWKMDLDKLDEFKRAGFKKVIKKYKEEIELELKNLLVELNLKNLLAQIYLISVQHKWLIRLWIPRSILYIIRNKFRKKTFDNQDVVGKARVDSLYPQ
jgi:hypothetical protein